MRVVSRALCPPVVPALLSRIVWSAVLLGCASASGTVWAADAPAAAKAADKPASKAADKAHDKAHDKHADKSADKPAEKSADKPVERSADRAAEKAAEKPADKTAPPATAAPAPARASAQDPLDRLRDALEARLGATPGKPYPGATPAATVQVAARAPGEFQVTAGRPSAAAAHVGSRAAKRAAPAAHPPGAEHHPHWSYAGETGPDQWAKLKPEFNLCAIGQRQSPIDIRDGFPVEHEPVVFEYRPGGFTVVNNGHTLQANVEAGNRILVGGRSYELVQFHFHHPAEERINGRGFDMVAHLVHKSADGRLAVVAVLLERGAPQSVVQTVWNHLPLEINQPVTGRVPLDPTELLPPDRRYYTYMGSLTTPPCTEGVLWVVLKQPVGVSVQQVQFFSRLYPMNARPLQNAAGRVIKQSQ